MIFDIAYSATGLFNLLATTILLDFNLAEEKVNCFKSINQTN